MLTESKKYLPWWTKVALKLVLSRIPVAYSVWQRMGLFRHGNMDSARYALDVFHTHIKKAGLDGNLRGKCILEMGPGDSIATAIIAHAYGACAILMDAGPFAKGDARSYTPLFDLLGATSPSLDLSNVIDMPSLLAICGGEYHTRGLESWRRLPSESVDFVFSQAVLEHIRHKEFVDTMRESYRVVKPGGIASHRVDLRDHLGGGLNNLRFSKKIWESDFFSRSGFYTNRIQYRPILEMLCESGWQIADITERRWLTLPTPQSKMAMPFRKLPADDLMISGFDVLLRKATL